MARLGVYGIVPGICLLLGALLYRVSGADGLERGLPVLALAIAADWLDLVFSRHAFGVYRGMPRRVQHQLAVEFALFWWGAARATAQQTDLTLAHLLRAQRTAGAGSSQRRRIDEIVESIGRGVDDSIVRDGLRDCIRNAETGSDHRRPNTRRTIFSAAHELPLAAVLAVGAVLAAKLAMHSRALAVEDGIVAAALFLAFHHALALGRKIEEKLRAIRGQSSFRTLFVSDHDRDDTVSWLARRFYSGVGHLVTVFIDEGSPELWHTRLDHSADYFFTVRKQLGAAIDGFVQHTDLLVIYIQDPELADEVREATSLPSERCLALSRDGSHPAGYVWLDPATLRTDPGRFGSRWMELDPYVRSVAPAKGLLSLWPLYALAVGALVLLPFARSLSLIGLIGLAFLGGAFPNIVGRRRAAAISRCELRAPKAPEATRRLDPRKLNRYLNVSVVILLLVSVAVLVDASGVSWSELGFPVFAAVAAFAAPLIQWGIVGGVLQALKWYLDWRFRVVILRRNTVSFGYAHKAMVMAECGKYAQVRVISDHSLGQTDTGTGERRESSQGLWLAIFSEMEHALEPDTFVRSWQRQVIAEMEVTDLAVFDWAQDVTDNMRWELEVASARLPPHRILVAHSPELRDEVESLRTRYGPFRAVALHRERDDEYIWPSNAEFAAGFAQELYETLLRLRIEPRKPADTAAWGACALPHSTPRTSDSSLSARPP